MYYTRWYILVLNTKDDRNIREKKYVHHELYHKFVFEIRSSASFEKRAEFSIASTGPRSTLAGDEVRGDVDGSLN